MKTIFLPADTEHLYLDEVAHLIADYRNPEGPNDPDGVRYALDKIQAESELHQAAKGGQLRVRHPGTHGPFPMELGLKRAVLLVPDVVAYLADRGMAVVMCEPEQSTPPQVPSEHNTAKPAPVAQGGSVTLWTTERKDDARAMMNELRGQGNKAFAKKTADAFGVTPTRLREVLNDKPKKVPAKKAKTVWDV